MQLVLKVSTYHQLDFAKPVTLLNVLHVTLKQHALNANQGSLFQVMELLPHQHVLNVTIHVLLVSNLQTIAKHVQQVSQE